MSNPEWDVAVIGAGPVGLMLASELTRHGARCKIIDKSPGTKPISKALIQHVRTQEVMDAVGAIDAVRAIARPLNRVEVHAYRRHAGHWQLNKVESPYPGPVILGQDKTEHILESHLKKLGGEVEWNCEGIGIEDHGDAVTIRVKRQSGEGAVTAKYAVGCEGSNSLVRETAGFTFEGERYTGEQFIQADAKINWSYPKGASHLFLTDKGYMMVIEMPGDLVRIFVSLPDDNPPRTDDPSLDDVERALKAMGAEDASLSDPVWLARYRTSHRTANAFRNGRLLVAGDAGHVHVPIGGQGMNTGLQDAFNLGWKLAAVASGRANESLLDSYSAERVAIAEQLIAGTDRAYRFVLHPGRLAKGVAKHFGSTILGLEAVQNGFRTTLEEIGINYRKGPLTEERGGHGRVHAGDRAPDATVVDAASGNTMRLFDLMRGTHWTMLIFSGLDDVAEDHAAIAKTAESAGARVYFVSHGFRRNTVAGTLIYDRSGGAHEAYDIASAAIYLVRPDWYVGFRGGMRDRDALANYLGRAGILKTECRPAGGLQ